MSVAGSTRERCVPRVRGCGNSYSYTWRLWC